MKGDVAALLATLLALPLLVDALTAGRAPLLAAAVVCYPLALLVALLLVELVTEETQS